MGASGASAAHLLLSVVLAAALLGADGQSQDKFPKCETPPRSCANFPQLTNEARGLKLIDWAISRTYGISNAAPFTTAIRNQSEADKDTVTGIVDVFKTTEDKIKAAREKTKGSDCNLRNHDWTKKAKRALFDMRKIGELDDSCTTAHKHTRREARRYVRLFRRSADAFQTAGKGLQKFTNPQWKKTYPLRSWEYSSTSNEQKCDIEKASGVKYKGKWYVQAQITNHTVQQLLPTRGRGFYEEWVPEDLCCPLTVWYKTFKLNETALPTEQFIESGNLKPYTTITLIWEGQADLSAFYNMGYDDNRPLTSALLANALAVDQAQDATRLSNIAILALPMAMSFIPVAVIADVNDFAAFIYVLFTDFFSAIPFIIKGIELYVVGTDVQTNAETWIAGSGDLFVAESWVAACQPLSKYKKFGIAFITIGFAVMLSGFFLEHVARKYMRRRISAGDQPRPLGEALFPISHHPLIPRDYDEGDTAAPNFGADLPPPPPTAPPPFSALYRRFVRRRSNVGVQDVGENGHPVIGTGAGFGAALVGSAVRGGPTPRQATRASDERWYDGP